MALGAAFYGKLRQDATAARRLLIRAGSARSYYVGVASEDKARRAVCVIPKGTEEGTRFELEREFSVLSNQPAAFTLYSSIDRADTVGHRSRRRPGAASRSARDRVPLWKAFPQGAACGAPFGSLHGNGHAGALVPRRRHGHKWRLAFNLRGAEADPLDAEPEAGGDDGAVIVEDEAVERSKQLLGAVFGQGSSPAPRSAHRRARDDHRARQARVAALDHPRPERHALAAGERACQGRGIRSAVAQSRRPVRARASAARSTNGGCRSCAGSTPPAWRFRARRRTRWSGWFSGSGSARASCRPAARARAAGLRAAGPRPAQAAARQRANRAGELAAARIAGASRRGPARETRRRADRAHRPRAAERQLVKGDRPVRRCSLYGPLNAVVSPAVAER